MAKNDKVKIKLKQSIAGHNTRFNPETGETELVSIFAHQRDDVLDWDAEEAKRFAERGIASIVAA